MKNYVPFLILHREYWNARASFGMKVNCHNTNFQKINSIYVVGFGAFPVLPGD